MNVSLKRIAVYLNEDEISEQVLSTVTPPRNEEPENEYGYKSELGIVGGSFMWNVVEEGKEKNRAKNQGESLADKAHRFELRDINVMFPEGELTLITGPTASGKTALLVSILFHPVAFSTSIVRWPCLEK